MRLFLRCFNFLIFLGFNFLEILLQRICDYRTLSVARIVLHGLKTKHLPESKEGKFNVYLIEYSPQHSPYCPHYCKQEDLIPVITSYLRIK